MLYRENSTDDVFDVWKFEKSCDGGLWAPHYWAINGGRPDNQLRHISGTWYLGGSSIKHGYYILLNIKTGYLSFIGGNDCDCCGGCDNDEFHLTNDEFLKDNYTKLPEDIEFKRVDNHICRNNDGIYKIWQAHLYEGEVDKYYNPKWVNDNLVKDKGAVILLCEGTNHEIKHGEFFFIDSNGFVTKSSIETWPDVMKRYDIILPKIKPKSIIQPGCYAASTDMIIGPVRRILIKDLNFSVDISGRVTCCGDAPDFVREAVNKTEGRNRIYFSHEENCIMLRDYDGYPYNLSEESSSENMYIIFNKYKDITWSSDEWLDKIPDEFLKSFDISLDDKNTDNTADKSSMDNTSYLKERIKVLEKGLLLKTEIIERKQESLDSLRDLLKSKDEEIKEIERKHDQRDKDMTSELKSTIEGRLHWYNEFHSMREKWTESQDNYEQAKDELKAAYKKINDLKSDYDHAVTQGKSYAKDMYRLQSKIFSGYK